MPDSPRLGLSEVRRHRLGRLVELASTHGDEGLVEAVEAQVPDEPPADERRHEPEVEVGHHQERRATHHPRRQGQRSAETGNNIF